MAKRRENPAFQAYMIEYQKGYRKRTEEQQKAYQLKRRQDPAKQERDRALRKKSGYLQKYGITPEQAVDMLAGQGWCCALCARELSRESMNVDHCHTTGRVRGILCTRCNSALGALGDNPAGLFRALQYVSEKKTDALAASVQQAIGVAK